MNWTVPRVGAGGRRLGQPFGLQSQQGLSDRNAADVQFVCQAVDMAQ